MTDIQHPPIAFIGAGNMARCLINGLIANEYLPHQIWATNRNPDSLHFLHQQFHVHTTVNNIEAAKQATIVVLAVKPQMMQIVAEELAQTIQQQRPLVVSIAAGITEATLRQWLGNQETAIVRCMPNLPAFVGSSATGMYANSYVNSLQRDLAESIMRAVGITLWVDDEKHMDVIAALSGSGPAYFFLVMEALEAAAKDLGLPQEDAHLFTLQTALGAARLAMSTTEPMVELRQRVTSKGGITERALAELESQHVREAFAKALQAAYDRSVEIAKLF